MANHVLSLEIPTVGNPCVLKIFDTSVDSVDRVLPPGGITIVKSVGVE